MNDYNNVWENSDSNYVNCPTGDNDISVDPEFVIPNPDWIVGEYDFHLQPTSHCIDAGDNDAIKLLNLPLLDLDDNPRIVNGDGIGGAIVDMGAFEYQAIIEIEATIDVDPNTLNLKSKGKWITAYIGLPEGYDINNIYIETVKLHYNGNSVEADWGDSQGTVYMVKFSRKKVVVLLSGVSGDAELEVTGKAGDITFRGFNTIRVK